MRREVDREEPNAPLWSDERVSFDRYHFPLSYIDLTASWLERFGVLPRAGGLDDQDRKWVSDMNVRFAIKSQLKAEKKPESE